MRSHFVRCAALMLLLSGSLGCEGAILRAQVGGDPVQGTQLGLRLLVFGLLLSKDGWWRVGRKGRACSHLEYQALSCKHGELRGVFRRNFGGLDFKDNVLGGSVYSGSQKGEQRRLHRNPDMGTGFQCENGSDDETPVPGRSQ